MFIHIRIFESKSHQCVVAVVTQLFHFVRFKRRQIFPGNNHIISIRNTKHWGFMIASHTKKHLVSADTQRKAGHALDASCNALRVPCETRLECEQLQCISKSISL